MRNVQYVLNTLDKFRRDMITLTVSKDKKGETISSLPKYM